MIRSHLAALPLAALLALGSAPAEPIDLSPIDCAGPAIDAEPGTPEWDERDRQNMYCSEERHIDKAHPNRAHPVPVPAGRRTGEGYREPELHDGTRFRYELLTVAGLDAELYRPCTEDTCSNMPEGLRSFEPPYPAAVVLHGGISRKEHQWWSSQPLAEAGYLVIAFDGGASGPSVSQTRSAIAWLKARDDVDPARIGVAGHSAGGVTSNNLQNDPDVAAIVSWDRAQSGQMPSSLPITTPALFLFADYNCQAVPVCQPERQTTPPNPDGPGNKGNDFIRLRDAGVDTMQIALRAALHLDWVGSALSGNRYAESVIMHFTTAWFDRYLAGDAETAEAGFERLTAGAFDDSADLHNISQGFWDPVQAATSLDPLHGGNVPYRISGMPVPDRLSFYFRSKCFLTPPDSTERIGSDDMRADGGC